MSILFFSSCKEELLQPKEEETKPKVTDVKVVTETFLEAKQENENLSRKERLEKFKKEHSKPYALLQKPEEILKEFLANRKTNKAAVNSFKNTNIKTLQTDPCEYLETEVWAFEKYQPISGKVVGVSPKPAWQNDIGTLQSLHNTFGFQGVFVAETLIDEAGDAGFLPSEIYIVICELSAFYAIMNLYTNEDFMNCYINEPLDYQSYSYTVNILSSYGNQWRQKFGGPIIMGIQEENYADEFDDLFDIVTITTYNNYWYNIDHLYDQRPVWTDWNSHFGSKFNALWISGPDDDDEFDLLTGHASNLGKNMISLYFGGPECIGYSNETCWNWVYNFCYWSWLHYYLDRVERVYTYRWHYVGNGDSCTDNQITSWELYDIIDNNDLRIRMR